MSMVADFFMAAGGAAAGYVIVGLAAGLEAFDHERRDIGA